MNTETCNLNNFKILDGSIGSFLHTKHPEYYDKLIWMSDINIANPNAVAQVHIDYVKAGANIITSNTFRTNPAALANYYQTKFDNRPVTDEDIDYYVSAALNICKSVKDIYPDILIAGSNPPAEECYTTEQNLTYEQLKDNHTRHIRSLYQNGAEVILNETISHMNEVEIICDYCNTQKIPFMVSLFFNENLTLLSGESVYDVIKYVEKFSPIAVCANCIFYDVFKKFINNGGTELISNLTCGFGYYLNCGSKNFAEHICEIDPTRLSQIIEEFSYLKTYLIGTCCLSNPEHTKAISNYFEEKK